MSDDFDRELRATLRSGADATRTPDGLAERLVANARAGHNTVVPLRSARRARWTAPLLAAAAVLVVVGGSITAATISADGGNGDERPVAPTTTAIPTPDPTPSPSPSTGAPSRSHTAAPTITHTPTHAVAPVTARPAPGDFRAAAVQFRDALHGYAFGTGDCTSGKNCKVRLIATDDGGGSWYRLGNPSGLHSMFPTTETDGSCSDNGDILGPCVDHVLFADARHGYLYGLHGFYRTDDGGAHWQRESPSHAGVDVSVTALAVHGTEAYRILADGPGSSGVPGRVQRAAVGSDAWADAGPGQVQALGSQLIATGSAIYVSSPASPDAAMAVLYRSSDGGATWSRVASSDTIENMAASPDGALGALLGMSDHSCTLKVWSPQGGAVSTHHLARCTDDGKTLVGLPDTRHPVLLYGRQGALELHRSTDSGATFTSQVSFGHTLERWYFTVQFDGTVGWSLTSGNQVHVTTDGGAHWHTVTL